MSQRNEVTIPAHALARVREAFAAFTGDRPVMLSYRIGRVLDVVGDLHQAFVERMQPYLTEGGMLAPDNLSEEDIAAVEEILNEQLTFTVRPVALTDMDEAGLRVSDDDAIRFLLEHGLLTA